MRKVKPTFRTTNQLFRATLRIVRENPRFLFFSALSSAVLFVPLILFFYWATATNKTNMLHSVGWIIASGIVFLPVTFLQMLCQTALFSVVLEKLRGQELSYREAFQRAWSLRKVILSWTVLSVVVYTGLSLLERIPFLGKWAGRIIAWIGGAAWALVSFFVIPIFICENLSVKEACKRSLALIRQRWGEAAIGVVSISLIVAIPFILLMMIGIVLWVVQIGGQDIQYFMVGMMCWIALGSILGGLIHTTFTSALYVYAVEGVVPNHFTKELLDQAWIVKNSRAESFHQGTVLPGLDREKQKGKKLKKLLIGAAIVLGATLLWLRFSTMPTKSPRPGATIHNAVRSGNLVTVKALLKANPQCANEKDIGGYTPLHSAASTSGSEGHLGSADLDVVELLLKYNADVNAKDKLGMTPLHLAAAAGHTAVVGKLLKHNVDVNATEPTCGRTPLHFAMEKGHVEVVKLLLAAKADVNAKDKWGNSPIYEAVSGDIYLQRSGKIPLHEAGAVDHLAVAELLLDHGADVNGTDLGGSIPLLLAAANGRKAFVELLLKHKADVNAASTEGPPTLRRTPLHWAARGGYVEVVKLLLDAKANVNAKDTDSKTPLSYANEKGHKETADLLRKYGAKE